MGCKTLKTRRKCTHASPITHFTYKGSEVGGSNERQAGRTPHLNNNNLLVSITNDDGFSDVTPAVNVLRSEVVIRTQQVRVATSLVGGRKLQVS